MKQEKDAGYSSQFKCAITSLPVKPQNTAGGKVILDIQVKKDPLDHSIDRTLSRKNQKTRTVSLQKLVLLKKQFKKQGIKEDIKNAVNRRPMIA